MHNRSERSVAALLVLVGAALSFPGRMLVAVGHYIEEGRDAREELQKLREARYQREERERTARYQREKLASKLARKKRRK